MKSQQPMPGPILEVTRVPKPWGHEEVFALAPGKFCGKTLHVTAGHSLSLQYHRKKEEIIAVQSGEAQLEFGPADDQLETVKFLPGMAIHLLPGMRHRISALADTVLLEASTTELDDVVRVSDAYGRAGTSNP